MSKRNSFWRRSAQVEHDVLPAQEAATEHMRLAARIPGLFGPEPLLRIDVDVEIRQDADGETMRITAQMDGHLNPPSAQALSAPRSRSHALKLAAQEQLGKAVERVARHPVVSKALNKAAGHIRSQLVVEATTRPLARGTNAMIPAGLKQAGFGTRDAEASEHPIVEAWEGTVNDGRGRSHVGVVQIAKRHLPEKLIRNLGDRPLNITAVIAHQIEPKRQAR